jgi:hypothetical protein
LKVDFEVCRARGSVSFNEKGCVATAIHLTRTWCVCVCARGLIRGKVSQWPSELPQKHRRTQLKDVKFLEQKYALRSRRHPETSIDFTGDDQQQLTEPAVLGMCIAECFPGAHSCFTKNAAFPLHRLSGQRVAVYCENRTEHTSADILNDRKEGRCAF